MEIKTNKEIREYKESIFWGLSLRQFLFSCLGIAVSVGIYFLLRNRLGTGAVSWACIFGMLPCALLGFVTYNKMPAEKFLWAVIKSEILTPKRLTVKTTNIYYSLINERQETHSDKKNRVEKKKRIRQNASERAGHHSGKNRL